MVDAQQGASEPTDEWPLPASIEPLRRAFEEAQGGPAPEVCPVCDGDGEVECPHCGGDACDECLSTGRIECTDCEGEG